jgi:ABC-2 type transport system permease protein
LSNLNVIYLSFQKEWKSVRHYSTFVYRVFGDVTLGIGLAWIASQSGIPAYLPYIIIGVFVMTIWVGIIGFGGQALNSELWGRTLEYTLISRTPLIIILFSKIVTQLVLHTPYAIATVAGAWLVIHRIPEIANPGLMPIALIFTIIGLVCIGLLTAPLMVLIRGGGGIIVGFMPVINVLSGVSLPVTQLPPVLKWMAYIVPSSWGMDSVWLCINGTDTIWPILADWGMFILISSIWVVAAYYLCRTVERRIMIDGTLGSY